MDIVSPTALGNRGLEELGFLNQSRNSKLLHNLQTLHLALFLA